MRNLLALVAAVVISFFALGWYLDWYKIDTGTAEAGRRSVTLDVNTEKINADSQKGIQKIKDAIENPK